LQLTPAIFTIFYHYASGKKSRAKADDLTLSFVLGAETFNTIMFLLLYIIYYTIFYNLGELKLGLFPWIMAGVFLALAFISFFFYYRKSRGTELYISRKIAKNLLLRAKDVKNRSDAFLLGCFSGTAELLFTMPLFIISVVISNHINFAPRALLHILLISSISIPIFSYFLMYRGGYNFAEITRRRVKNKPFFRFIIPLAYLLLVFACINIGLAQ
jgi:hypothetical protein